MSEINKIKNEHKYTYMIYLLNDGEIINLSKFLTPWIQYQRSENITEIYHNHTLFISKGKYFEFLRWLIFKMINESKYIDNNTLNLLIFFENGLDLTGIFRIKKGGLLYDLLTNCNLNRIFYHTDTIVTISNTQLVYYINEYMKIHKDLENKEFLSQNLDKNGGYKKSKKIRKIRNISRTKVLKYKHLIF